MNTHKKRKERKKKSRKVKGGGKEKKKILGNMAEKTKNGMIRILQNVPGINRFDSINMSKSDYLMKQIDGLLKSKDWVEIWTSEKWRNTLKSQAYRVLSGRSYKDALVERNDFYGKKLKEMQKKFNDTYSKIKEKSDKLKKISKPQDKDIDATLKMKNIIQTKFIDNLSAFESLYTNYNKEIEKAIEDNEKLGSDDEVTKAIHLDEVVKEFTNIITEFNKFHKDLNEKTNKLNKIKFTKFEKLEEIKKKADEITDEIKDKKAINERIEKINKIIKIEGKKKEVEKIPDKKNQPLADYIRIRGDNITSEHERHDLLREIEELRLSLIKKEKEVFLNNKFSGLVFLVPRTKENLEKLVESLKLNTENEFDIFKDVDVEEETKPKEEEKEHLSENITEEIKLNFAKRSNFASKYSDRISGENGLISELKKFIDNMQNILNSEKEEYKNVFGSLEEKNNTLIKGIQEKLKLLSETQLTNIDVLSARYSTNPIDALKEIEKNIKKVNNIQGNNALTPSVKDEFNKTKLELENAKNQIIALQEELQKSSSALTDASAAPFQSSSSLLAAPSSLANASLAAPSSLANASLSSSSANAAPSASSANASSSSSSANAAPSASSANASSSLSTTTESIAAADDDEESSANPFQSSKKIATTSTNEKSSTTSEILPTSNRKQETTIPLTLTAPQRKEMLDTEIGKLKEDLTSNAIDEANKENIVKFLSILDSLNGKSPTKEQFQELTDIIEKMPEMSGGGNIRGGNPKKKWKI